MGFVAVVRRGQGGGRIAYTTFTGYRIAMITEVPTALLAS